MITRLQGKEIIKLWSKGLTNIQISNSLEIGIRSVISVLNRNQKLSNRYELIDESKIKQLLIGSYLGDGNFEKIDKHKESRLNLIHSDKYSDYLEWKADKLREVNLFNSINRYKLVNKSGYVSNLITTKSKTNPVFTEYRILGYDQCLGYINLDLIRDISEEGFAIWYFDDGCVLNDGVAINCSSIPYEEKEEIKKIIYNNLKLVVNITPDTLYIPKNQMYRFLEIVTPFCVESMKYKLFPYHQRKAHVKSCELLENP